VLHALNSEDALWEKKSNSSSMGELEKNGGKSFFISPKSLKYGKDT